MAFSDEELLARIDARCRELGRSRRSILMEAGVAEDLLKKTPTAGRRIDTLEKLCVPLQWTLQEIMGFPKVSADADSELMRMAFKAVRRALRGRPDADEIMPDVVTIAYNALLHHRQDGQALDANALAMLEASIAAQLGFAKRPRE